MRVLLVSYETAWAGCISGAAYYVSGLAQYLRRRGHWVHVLTREATQQYGVVDGVYYHAAPVFWALASLEEVNAQNEAWARQFEHLETTSRFDIINVHDWSSVPLLARLSQLGRPTVWTIFMTEKSRGGNSDFIRELEATGLRSSARTVVCSPPFRRDVLHDYSCKGAEGNMAPVPCAVDVRKHEEANFNTASLRTSLGIQPHEYMVLFCGKMVESHGVDLLVDALPVILRSVPMSKFVLVRDGLTRSGLEERVARLGSSTHLKTSCDLLALFKSCDLFVLPSRVEPFGMVLLEAWACRQPVVATCRGGAPWFAHHRHDSILVDLTAASIASAILALLHDINLARVLAAGRDTLQQNFSYAALAELVEAVYKSTLATKSPTAQAQHFPGSLQPMSM